MGALPAMTELGWRPVSHLGPCDHEGSCEKPGVVQSDWRAHGVQQYWRACLEHRSAIAADLSRHGWVPLARDTPEYVEHLARTAQDVEAAEAFWEYDIAQYVAAVADPGSVDPTLRGGIDEFASSTGRPPISWPVVVGIAS